jgi:hypothetical protein
MASGRRSKAMLLLARLLPGFIQFLTAACNVVQYIASLTFGDDLGAGWRADKVALICILAHRTAAQRSVIRRAYAFLFREPMVNCFHLKLSRHRPVSDFWVQ